MSITSSEKIFVDPNDEITFVIERLLISEKTRIILVIPQNSILLSSYVSISILLRKVVKSDKLAAIVTEDEYGQKMSERIGFVVVSKVSQINSDVWEVARNKKLKLQEELNLRKKELLSNIIGEQDEIVVIDSVELKNDKVVIDPIKESKIFNQEEVEKTKEKTKEQEEYKSLIPYKKTRAESKIINLDGIQILSGGDIKIYIDEYGSDKISNDGDKEIYYNNYDGESNIMGNLNKNRSRPDRKIKNSNLSSFTNKDFTRAVKGENKLTTFFNSIFKPKRIQDPNERYEGISQQKKTNRRKIFLIFIVLIIILAGLLGYLMAFKFSKVDIILKLKKEDVSTSATIVVNPSINQITTNPLTIPGKLLSQDKSSISRTGTSDGTGRKGNKAQGNITMYNFQTASITLKAGNKVTNTSNNLIYSLVKDTTLDAAKFGSDGVKNPSKKDDIPIVASDFGTNYNVTDVPNPIKYTVDGFTSDAISSTEFNSITGGTLETFISVSKDNITKLHDSILPDLKAQILDKIRQSTPTGYKLIEGSVIYTETATKSFPDQDQESKDKIFNLTVEMTANAITIKNDDLVSAVSTLLQNSRSQNSSDSFVVGNVNDPLINKVDKTGNNYVLTISSKGSLTANITIEQMKKDIEGLNIQQTKDYFSTLNSIDQYIVSFSPDFIPNSIKRVPHDPARINIISR